MNQTVIRKSAICIIIAVLMLSLTFNIITADKKPDRKDAIMVMTITD